MLNEGRVEDAMTKYPNVDVHQLAAFDPSPTKKYVMWMAKQKSKGHIAQDIGPTVNEFDRVGKNLQKKAIEQYDDLKELEDALKEYDFKKSANKKEKSAHEDAEFISEENGYQLYHIKSHAASCQLGRGTKWCITMSKSGYWDEYNKSSVFFFCIPTSANDEKFALQISLTLDVNITQTKEEFVNGKTQIICWNSKDKKVPVPNILLNHAEVAKKIFVDRFEKKLLDAFNVKLFPISADTFASIDNLVDDFDNKIATKLSKNKFLIKKYNAVVDQLNGDRRDEFDKYFVSSAVSSSKYTSKITGKSIQFEVETDNWNPSYKESPYDNDTTAISIDPCVILVTMSLVSKKPLDKEIEKIIDRIAKNHGYTIDDVYALANKIIDRA